MSWYYTYSLGVQDAEGKIYPILFTPQNERLDIVKNSRSFEPEELDSVFYPLHEENVTNALKEAYSCHEDGEDFDIDYKSYCPLDELPYKSYCPLDELPSGSYIKKAYVLISDVEEYEKDYPNDFDGFYERLSPQVYAAKQDAELKFGPPIPKKDDNGYDITEHSARDYMWYVWEDTHCAEYYAAQIRNIAAMFPYNYLEKHYGKNARFVAILFQG